MRYLGLIIGLILVTIFISGLLSYRVGFENGRQDADQLWGELYCINACLREDVASCGIGAKPNKFCEEWLEGLNE